MGEEEEKEKELGTWESEREEEVLPSFLSLSLSRIGGWSAPGLLGTSTSKSAHWIRNVWHDLPGAAACMFAHMHCTHVR